MATYLVHRCHYNNPSEKALRVFEADETVLDWFRNRWDRLRESARNDTLYDELDNEIGFGVYGLWSIFARAEELDISAPANDAELGQLIDLHLYTELSAHYRAHLLQVCTDDDELEQSYYIFDDKYLKSNNDKCAFLMHEDWQLPIGFGDAKFEPDKKIDIKSGYQFDGKGEVYFCLSECVDGANFDAIAPVRFSGIRLPDFPRLLFAAKPTNDWPRELRLLRSQMFFGKDDLPGAERHLVEEIYQDPSNSDPWMVYSDWLTEQQLPPIHIRFLQRAFAGVGQIAPGEIDEGFGLGTWSDVEEEAAQLASNYPAVDSKRTGISVSEHMAQASLFCDRFEYPSFSYDIFHQWWLFDDRWAGENEDLAQGLLKFCVDWQLED